MNIFALSSGRGPCGIAIIRMSGPDTLNICKLISKEKKIKENILKNFSKSSLLKKITKRVANIGLN